MLGKQRYIVEAAGTDPIGVARFPVGLLKSHRGCNLYSAVLASRRVLTDIYPVEPLLLALEFRERCENLGAMTTWINTRPEPGDFSVGTH